MLSISVLILLGTGNTHLADWQQSMDHPLSITDLNCTDIYYHLRNLELVPGWV